MKVFLHTVTVAISMVMISTSAWSQGTTTPSPKPIVIGEEQHLYSEILDEDRVIFIYKPRDYDDSDAAYPVLYVLDGERHFHHGSGIVDYIADRGIGSPMLVVALPNTNRDRDLTPALTTPDENYPTAGGADNFIKFLSDELIPFVESNYRASHYRALFGHSYGGLFVIHTMLTEPRSFNAYFASSPSLWWDNKAIIQRARTFFEAKNDLQGFLYLTMDNEGGDMLSSVWELAAILEEDATDSLEWHFRLLDDETHNSIHHRVMYDALDTLFDDWVLQNPAELVEAGGIASINAHYEGLLSKFGYPAKPTESMLNNLGYQLLNESKPAQASEVFQHNVTLFPHSANVYDSLGDGYDANGQSNEAKDSYEKACSLGRDQAHPRTPMFCANLERVTALMTGQPD